VGLCFFHGPVAALLQVANRLSGVEEGRLEPLLALLVLRHEGILDVLERHPLTLAPAASLGASAEMPTSRFLVGAAAEPQGPSDLVKLLALCYHQSGSFPGAFARGLRSRLLELLEDWARQIAEAASFEELWRAGRSLFSALLRGPETELREEVFALLHDNPRLVIPGSQLARLTREALTTPPV
jgi:hypothetical protein